MCLVASVCLCVCLSVCLSELSCVQEKRCHFSTGAEWSILVLGFSKYSKRSSETQVSYTLKNIIECSSQGAFKMGVVSKIGLTQFNPHGLGLIGLTRVKCEPCLPYTGSIDCMCGIAVP